MSAVGKNWLSTILMKDDFGVRPIVRMGEH